MTNKEAAELKSHPAWVCGLKLTIAVLSSLRAESHPAWVCGLKQEGNKIITTVLLSHPAWVCGLKLNRYVLIKQVTDVTPCVGVWIETLYQCHGNNRQ